MITNNSFMEKKNSFSKLKGFSSRNDFNIVFSRCGKPLISPLSLFPLNIRLKISVYNFLKLLKSNRFCGKARPYNAFGWALQENGFYYSIVEESRKRRMALLRQKLYSIVSNEHLKYVYRKVVCPVLLLTDNRNLKSLSKGLDKYLKFYVDSLDTIEKRRAFLKILKSRKFLSNIYFSRLFLFSTKHKKKYKSTFFYFFRRRQKVRSLFHLFAVASLKFKYFKRQHYKVVKRLVWKLKKSKKWKRHSSLFWLRQKLSQVFYVPKHLEVNYKTFSSKYLGFTDFDTTNVRIPFWLNLRKLLTFVS